MHFLKRPRPLEGLVAVDACGRFAAPLRRRVRRAARVCVLFSRRVAPPTLARLWRGEQGDDYSGKNIPVYELPFERSIITSAAQKDFRN